VKELWIMRVENQHRKMMRQAQEEMIRRDWDEVDGEEQGADSTESVKHIETRMWADAQRDGRPAEYR